MTAYQYRGLYCFAVNPASVQTEKMETAENSLSFFTTNHSKHDSQWRMTGANISVVCVACLVELLESPDVLHLRKRKVLREVVFLLSNSQSLLELLSQNARITSHLCSIIMNLLSSENELLMNTAIEALDIITLKLRPESLVAEIVEKLETQILRLNNFKKSYPFVLALGRLLKAIPALSFVIAKDLTNLVEYFLSNILFPEDNIQAAFLFVLVQICSNEDALSAMSSHTKEKICSQTCAVIACTISVEVHMNALGVLKLFSTHPDVLNTTLIPSNKSSCAMLECLKKLMLSPNEAVQIGAIQCVTQILKNDPADNAFTKAFLTSGICEMLLEDLESSNDIVLGSVFCSLDYMARSQTFYSEGYSVYGIESVIVGVSKAIKLKSPEIIRQGIRVLSVVLSMQPSSVQLFPSEELCKLCANVLHECLKFADHKVLTQAACAVEHFLSVHHHPSSMEFETVAPLVSTVISHLQKFIKPRMHFRNVSKGTLEILLCALFRVIKKTFQFVKDYRTRDPSYATLLTRNSDAISSENEALDQFLESLWKAIDQICVPAMMLNYESLENPAVFTDFFEILHLLVSQETTCRDIFARKLASGSFVRLSLEIKEKFGGAEESRELSEAITRFLLELCLALSDATEMTQLGERLIPSNIGCAACIRSPSACLNLLAQSSVRKNTNDIVDESLFNAQCLCIELLYVSFSHGDKIVPREELVSGLHKYLILHPDLSILPRFTLKHLLFLWITSCKRLSSLPLPASAIESINVSQGILEQSLVRLKAEEFETIYIHDVLFVSWIFSCESLTQIFGRQVLICFTQREETNTSFSDKALHQVLTSNVQSLRTFVSLVDCSEEAIVNRVVSVLEGLFSGDSDSDPSATENVPRIALLANHIPSIFHKLFLGHKSNPLQVFSIVAMLKVMTVVQMNILAFDTKILYHVISLVTSTKSCPRFLIAAINYLNVTLAWDVDRGSHRVAAMLLSNKTYCGFIQEILDTEMTQEVWQQNNCTDDVNLLSSVIVLISSLAISQLQTHKDVHDPFKVDKRCMISLANETRNILRLSSLVFWDVFFRIKSERSEKPLVVLADRIGKEQPFDELTEVELRVLYVYLQNSLVHDSETVRQCSVKCLESFLSYVPDASSFASNPWNRIVLESQLSMLSVNVITPSLLLFCSLILQHKPKEHQFKDVLQNAVQSLLSQIPSVPCSEQEMSWHCINLLLQSLSLGDDIMSQVQKSAVAAWLAKFKLSLTTTADHGGGSDENIKFYKLDTVIFAKDLLKSKVRAEPELLTKVIRLLEDKIFEKYGETTNRIS